MSDLEPSGEHRAAALDRAAATKLGRRWVDAVNRRDAEALVELTDPAVAVYPTRILGDRGPYSGHEGLRRWIADVAETGVPLSERVTDVRHGPAGEIVVLGRLLVRGRPVSPISMLMTMRGGKVVEARAYLSDEAQLERIGRIRAGSR